MPVLGVLEAGEGPALLCVHGFPLDSSVWAHQVRGLSDARRVVAPDLRGRGRSPVSGVGWSIDDHADDLAATLDALGIEAVDLTGLSMGGYVAFAFLRRHRARVRSLVLVDTKSEADGPEGKAARLATAEMVRARGTLAIYDEMSPKLVAPGASAEVRDAVRGMFARTPGPTAAADTLAMRERPDSTPDLAGVAVPALVVRGELDALMPLASARAMADLIPGGRFVAIPGAGHLAPLEAPDAFDAAIRAFLAG